MRVQIPWWSKLKFDPWDALKAVKNLIGKDLSNLKLPINFFEPMTVLMKSGEMMFLNDKFLEAAKASDKPSSYRMMLVAASMI